MPSILLHLPDQVAPIRVTNLFDYDNDPVEDWSDAYVFVAGPLADGSWMADRVEDYQEAVRN